MSPDGSVKSPPEERLLRLIRGAAKAAIRPQPSPVAGGLAMPPPGRWWQTLAWPRLAVGALGLMLAIELLALIIQTLRPLPTVSAPPLPAPAQAPTAPTDAFQPLANLPSITEAAHPVFQSSGVSGSPSVSPRSPTGGARGLASRLTLMGIVSGEPAQAIIEDSQTKKTYFVSVGQMVVDGAMLEAVLDNRVVLVLDGERVELSL